MQQRTSLPRGESTAPNPRKDFREEMEGYALAMQSPEPPVKVSDRIVLLQQVEMSTAANKWNQVLTVT